MGEQNLGVKVDVPDKWPEYKSQSERDWVTYGSLILLDELTLYVIIVVYEPITFHIPGGRYKPDFMHIMADGSLVFVEVKGSKKGRGYARQRTKLRAVAELHPWFKFIEAVGSGEDWTVEVVE